MESNDILNKINREDGMTVPDGYFKSFSERMIASLPEQEWEKPMPKVMPRSFWQKVRPYAYMAAMFAGIWCMMKTFDLMRTGSSVSLEPSHELVSAINNDAFFNDYMIPAFDESSIYDDLYDEGISPEDLNE